MAETASVRTNILLTPSEHRSWTTVARARGISLAEYIRRSVAAAEAAPTADEMDQLEVLTAELTAAASAMHAAVDSALAQLRGSSASERDAAVARQVAAELAAAPVTFDPAILDFAA